MNCKRSKLFTILLTRCLLGSQAQSSSLTWSHFLLNKCQRRRKYFNWSRDELKMITYFKLQQEGFLMIDQEVISRLVVMIYHVKNEQPF